MGSLKRLKRQRKEDEKRPKKSNFNRNLLAALGGVYALAVAAFLAAGLANEPEFQQPWMLALNLVILSIPILLVLGAVYVLARARHERRTLGEVNPRLRRIIRWAPRAAAVLIILFMGLFSLDVFVEGAKPAEVAVGLLMHNLPSLALIVLLALAWKRPKLGFWAFLGAAALFVLFFVRSFYALSNVVIFVLPLVMIALLFYADWKWIEGGPNPGPLPVGEGEDLGEDEDETADERGFQI